MSFFLFSSESIEKLAGLFSEQRVNTGEQPFGNLAAEERGFIIAPILSSLLLFWSALAR